MADEADRHIEEGLVPDDLDPMYDPDEHREHSLVGWFKETFEERTPPKDVGEVLPSYRVSWTEIFAEMKDLGFGLEVLDARMCWNTIMIDHKIIEWCNKLLEKSGDSRRL